MGFGIAVYDDTDDILTNDRKRCIMVITWESIVVFAAAILTILGAWRQIVTLKRDILKNVQEFVCKAVTEELKPFVSNQADVLRYSITRAHADYIRQGYIDKYALQALEYLYRDYHGMNGNGFVDGLMHELRELPPQLPEKKILQNQGGNVYE